MRSGWWLFEIDLLKWWSIKISISKGELELKVEMFCPIVAQKHHIVILQEIQPDNVVSFLGDCETVLLGLHHQNYLHILLLPLRRPPQALPHHH